MRTWRLLGVLPLLAAGLMVFGTRSAQADNPCLPLKCPPSPTPSAAPSPSPQPPPSIELSTATGSPGDMVVVTGSYFGSDERIDIDWDGNPAQLLASQTADVNGNFNISVKIPNSPAGTHQICTVQPPKPCASFALLGAQPSPSPTPSPSPSPSPSPLPSPSPSPSGTSVGGPSYPNGSDTGLAGQLLTPPLVFLPLLLLAGGVALAVWWWRSRGLTPAIQAARVVHSSAAGEGSAEGWHAPASAPEPPGAQPEPEPQPPVSEPPAEEPPAEEPPAQPPWTSPGGDEPPDLPEPGD